MSERPEAELEAGRALAAQTFPREWAASFRVSGPHGQRQRTRLRHRALYAQQIAPLRAAGASCATCRHCGHMPNDKRRICDLDSDFHGYALVKPDGLCTRWQALGDFPPQPRSPTP